ncbi:hypothetical protein B0F90DRAFT_117210 [Multifurca ochricompacta]|uniref:Uncharacterized protein n=1 Tax=Multifurca ochricompacta TaxID=376703 RepID=A0AAD4MCZ9_9AGAM|nr:hypothetical protein B0F90DRAFT_117210 [Multifurca ochricompacta]
MDTTALQFFFLILHYTPSYPPPVPFSSHLHHSFLWCLTSGNGLTRRASAMHTIPFLPSRGLQIHTAEPLALYFPSCPPQKTIDPWLILGC